VISHRSAVVFAPDQEQRQRVPQRTERFGPIDRFGNAFARTGCPGQDGSHGLKIVLLSAAGCPRAEVSMHRAAQGQPFGFNGSLRFQAVASAARRSCSLPKWGPHRPDHKVPARQVHLRHCSGQNHRTSRWSRHQSCAMVFSPAEGTRSQIWIRRASSFGPRFDGAFQAPSAAWLFICAVPARTSAAGTCQRQRRFIFVNVHA